MDIIILSVITSSITNTNRILLLFVIFQSIKFISVITYDVDQHCISSRAWIIHHINEKPRGVSNEGCPNLKYILTNGYGIPIDIIPSFGLEFVE